MPPETVALLGQGLCDYTTQVGSQISYMLGAALLPSQIVCGRGGLRGGFKRCGATGQGACKSCSEALPGEQP